MQNVQHEEVEVTAQCSSSHVVSEDAGTSTPTPSLNFLAETIYRIYHLEIADPPTLVTIKTVKTDINHSIQLPILFSSQFHHKSIPNPLEPERHYETSIGECATLDPSEPAPQTAHHKPSSVRTVLVPGPQILHEASSIFDCQNSPVCCIFRSSTFTKKKGRHWSSSRRSAIVLMMLLLLLLRLEP